jgi:hypothetical protein
MVEKEKRHAQVQSEVDESEASAHPRCERDESFRQPEAVEGAQARRTRARAHLEETLPIKQKR